MEHNTFVVSGLTRKRAELSGELRALERRVSRLQSDLAALDHALRLFVPDIRPSDIKPKTPRIVRRKGMSRIIRDILRTADRPLTAGDIARQIAATQGLPMPTGYDRELMTNAVRTALARQKEGLASERREGKVFWRVAGAE